MIGPPSPSSAEIYFDAVLHPHRSLSSQGFLVLIGIVGVVGLVSGTVFFMMGAWPVTGFFGADLLLLYAAFRLNYRRAELYETVRLTDRELVVWRITRTGAPQSWVFEPTWVRVTMDDPPRHGSRIIVSSHGRGIVVGSFLTPDERAEFAQALREALYRWRESRRFAPDPNPGLRIGDVS